MKFNLSTREKNMLIGLLILILLAVFFRFVYLPITLEREATLSIHDSVMSEEDALMNSVLSNEALKDKIHDLQRVSKLLTKQLPPSVEQEYVIKDLLTIVSDNGVELLDFSFEGDDANVSSEGVESVDDALAVYEASMETKTNQINELKNMFSGETSSNSENDEEDDGLPIQYLSMSITCRGEYDHLKNIIKDFNELDNMVIVKEIMFGKETDSMKQVLATLTLDYPYFADKSDYSLVEWDGLELKGSEVDPFNYFIRGSQQDPNIPRTNISYSTPTYSDPLKPTKAISTVDFYLNARPKSSDDFAYTISKNGDSSYRLSSDLDGEEIELQIVDNNGKPAFKMGTKLRPITDTTKAVSFAPESSSSVNIKILSQPRVGDKDTATAVFRIKNTSSTQVIVTVQDEDSNNPRVKILKEGNVTVK